MPSLHVHKDFQNVRKLPFCYLCGRAFIAGDDIDGDHVPPKAIFNTRDRQPSLKLRTHRTCNSAFSVDDKKIGQLIALRRWERPNSARDEALQLVYHPDLGIALENLNVDAAVWRWVKGFHAALYRQPLIGDTFAIQTPFPRGDKHPDGVRMRPLPPQHRVAVETIKTNRAAGSLDVIVANNGQLRYECVWCLADDGVQWFCMFALDIYDWKDLGSHTDAIPARGCAGLYALPDRSAPTDAARNREQRIVIPNTDVFDPFAP
jgi:hypothetical protein